MTKIEVAFYHAADPGNGLLFTSIVEFVPRIGDQVSTPQEMKDGMAHALWEVQSVEWCYGDAVGEEPERPLIFATINLKPLGYQDPYKGGLIPLEDLEPSELAFLLPKEEP